MGKTESSKKEINWLTLKITGGIYISILVGVILYYAFYFTYMRLDENRHQREFANYKLERIEKCLEQLKILAVMNNYASQYKKDFDLDKVKRELEIRFDFRSVQQ